MFAYLKMLAVDRLASLFRPQSNSSKPKSKVKNTFKWIGIVALVLYVYATVVFLEMLVYEMGMTANEPLLLIAIVFLGCTLMTLVYSFFYVVSILFFGKDTTFLAALPITSRTIMSSKLLIVIAGEVGLTFLAAAPLIIRYGIETGASVGFYLRAVIGTIFVPFVPVAISALLSGVLIRISALWKRRESVTIIFCFLLMIGIMLLQMNLSMNAAEEQMGNAIASLLFGKTSLTEMLLNVYPPIKWLVNGISGSGLPAWGLTALFAAVSAAAIALVVWLLGGSYMRLALKQQENIRRANITRRKLGADKVKTPFKALLKQELRDVITVPVYATNCLTGCVVFPIMIVFMAITFQNNNAGLPLDTMISLLFPDDMLTVIIGGAMCFANIMCQAGATAVSREGSRHDLRKVFPISGYTHLSAKLAMSMIFNALCTLLCAVAVCVLVPSLWPKLIIGFLISLPFSLLFNALSLIVDVYRPRLNWKNETEAVKQNVNTLFSMLIGFGLCAALFGLFILFTALGLSPIAALAADVAVMAIADLLTMKWLAGKASQVYFAH